MGWNEYKTAAFRYNWEPNAVTNRPISSALVISWNIPFVVGQASQEAHQPLESVWAVSLIPASGVNECTQTSNLLFTNRGVSVHNDLQKCCFHYLTSYSKLLFIKLWPQNGVRILCFSLRRDVIVLYLVQLFTPAHFIIVHLVTWCLDTNSLFGGDTSANVIPVRGRHWPEQ